MQAKLLFANDANWRAATGTHISDPALWYQAPSGQTHIVVSELEIALMRTTAKVDHIHSFTDIKRDLNSTPLNLTAMVKWLMAKEPTSSILVPSNFGAAMFEKLKAEGLPLLAHTEDLFFPARAIKTLAETEMLAIAQRANEQCFHRAMKVLREADIARDGTLVWKGTPLTAELLQSDMNQTAVAHGAEEFHGGPIVACGVQGAMPHERGHGVLHAHQLIVIDCFPRHRNGYWGDLTRTFVKGKATSWQRELYEAVLGAQNVALGLIRAEVNGKDIHQAVVNHFAQAGFKTGTDDTGTPYGFFHGTGHGVGLELHEPGPRTISTASCILQSGYVTSVEPGLYYPSSLSGKGNVGGCRIEDVVVVTDHGHHNLTTFPKDKWIID